jgi:hypothetical protein
MKRAHNKTQTSFLTLVVLVMPWLAYAVPLPSYSSLLLTSNPGDSRHLSFDHPAFISTLLSWWLIVNFFIGLA